MWTAIQKAIDLIFSGDAELINILGTTARMSLASSVIALLIGVPVGIIDCYWGGTSITCWLDEETLNETAEGTSIPQ